jgi:hypothetical protein
MKLQQAIKNIQQVQHYHREEWNTNRNLGLDFSAGIHAGKVEAYWELIYILRLIQAEQEDGEEELAYKEITEDWPERVTSRLNNILADRS